MTLIGSAAAQTSSVGAPASIAQEIQTALAHPSEAVSRYHLNLGDVRRFYAARGYAPTWFGSSSSEHNSAVAITVLETADADGLDPSAYRIGAIRLRERLDSPYASAEFDLLLTASLLEYMHDLHLGRVTPARVENDIALPAVEFDPVVKLNDALAVGNLEKVLGSLRPAHQDYDDLKRALAVYRAIQAKGGWPQLSDISFTELKDGDPRLSLIWNRLSTEDSSLASKPGSADATGAAIRRYQVRNGLPQTGMIDRQTLSALNGSVEQRISQIIANMERWRWVSEPFGPRYIEVNTADATLKVVDRGDVVLTSRIVAGKRASPTPIFAAKVVAITINPYWNIPSSIARNEILPKERHRPGYLSSQDIFVADDGSLKQRPGPHNALGFLKLEMPNRFDAYLHDTPARALFARDDRHFSHGCMRVQQIEPVASWALTGDSAAAKDRLEALIATGANQRILLDRPIPVYVFYWTAIADQQGSVGFRSDVYGRDARLLAALAGHEVGRLSLNTNCQASQAG